MCGIVGFVNFDSVAEQDRKKWIHNALLVDQLRGVDSTGIAMIPKVYGVEKSPPDIRTYKRALAANDFLQLEGCEKIISDAAACKFVMGHNRFATTGDKNSDSFAHPFTYGEVTAIHNGTLTSRAGLTEAHTVDSAAITMELAKTDPAEYTKLLAQLQGAYTLVWYNAANHHVYFARNDKRPLFMAKGYKGDTLFFASEEWMITWLMDRINLTALDIHDKGKEKGNTKVWSMMTDMLVDIDLNQADYNFTEKKYKGYVAPPATSTVGYGKHWNEFSGYNTNDPLPIHRKNGVPVTNLTANVDCPYKVGETLFADSWNFVKHDSNKRKGGKIEGLSVDFPEVQFVVPNISNTKYKKLSDEWEQWKDAIVDAEGASDVEPLDIEEIFLIGEVTQVARLKNKNQWIANLKPKSLKVEFVVTPYNDAYEDIEDSEAIPEKKPEARTSTNAKIVGDNNAAKSWSVGTKKVGLDDWMAAVGGGCGYCTHELFMKDHDEIVWKSYIEDDKEVIVPICPSCSDFLFSSDTTPKEVK